MNACPDQNCRDKVTRTATIMKVGGTVLYALVIILIAWNGVRVTAESKQNDKIAKCSEKMPAMQQQVKNIEENIKEIKTDQKQMQIEIKEIHQRITETKDAILRAIRNNK